MPMQSESHTINQPDLAQAQVPTSDHVDRFWALLRDNEVRLLVELKRIVGVDAPDGPLTYWDVSTFSDDLAKALVVEHDQKT